MELTDTVDFESADDIALADKMNAAGKQIIAELQKRIIGQDDVIELVLLTLFVGGNSLIVGVPGPGQDAADRDAGAGARPEVQPHPVHARPDAVGHHRHRHHPGGRGDRPPADGVRARADLRATSCWPTKSTARRPRRSRRCSRRCRSTASRFRGAPTTLDEPFFVFATQNPIELEGTYPLPEAQLDRFMFHIVIEHPPEDEEFDVVRDDDGDHRSALQAAGDRRRSDRVPAAGAPRAGGRAGDALRAARSCARAGRSRSRRPSR